MKTRQLIVQNEGGLHLRVAAQIVTQVQQHHSAVHMHGLDRAPANAGSVFELLSLGAVKGTSIAVDVDGPDEEATLAALAEVFEGGAGI